jgi:hypothetical protein
VVLAIDVELFGQLSSGGQKRHTLSLERSMTVHEVAILLGVNPDEIGLITINGVQSEMDGSVPPDCRLCFFPPMAGG